MPVDRIIEWDVGNWSRCLEYWAPAVQGRDPSKSAVLAIGERNGGIALWFALQGFQVICSDRQGPTQQARALHAEFGVSHRVTYADVDVFSIPFPDDAFELVACKSVIGGLKRDPRNPATRTLATQSLAMREIMRVIRPGGYFLGAENLAGSRLHRLLRRIAKRNRIGWRHLTRAELDVIFREFGTFETECFGFFGSGIRHLRADRLGAFLDRWVSPMLPEDWLYIAFLRARKGGNLLHAQQQTPQLAP